MTLTILSLNESNQYLKKVVLIDMVGVPDKNLKEVAHKRNLKIIKEQGLDIVFIVKNDSGLRGNIFPADLIELNKSDIFMRTMVCFSPKLISVWAFNVDKLKDITEDTKKLTEEEYIDMKETYSKYLHLSLLQITKKKMSQEAENKLKQLILKDYLEFQQEKNKPSNLYFLNREHKEIEQRLSAFLYYPEGHPLRKVSIKSFEEILKEVYEFKKKKKMEVILSESYKVNTVIMCKYFSKMIRSQNNIMFKFLHKYKSTENIDIIKKLELEKTLTLFFREINKAKCNSYKKLKILNKIKDEKKISKLEENLNIHHTTIKKDFVEKIIKIFMDKIIYIDNFLSKKLEVKDSYVINSDLNENAYREILNSEINDLKSINKLGYKKRLKNIILEKYESIKDEYYFDKSNDFSKKDNFIKTLKNYKKNIESIKSKYTSDQNLPDFSDRPNDPALLLSKKSTNSVESSDLREEISREPVKKLEKLITGKLYNSNVNQKTKIKIKHQINRIKDYSKIHLSIGELNLPENHEFNIRFSLESNFHLVTLSLDSITCIDNAIKVKLNNILNKKYQLESNIDDQDNILDTIFIWLSSSNIVEELTNFNVYNFINNIRKTISTEKFLIFLFIEKNFEDLDRDKYNASLTKLIKLIESIDSNIKNSVIFVYVEEDNIEYNKKKTLMLNLADHLKLKRFFDINDSVSNILEYSDGLEDFKVHDNSTVRALNYMSKVLSHEIYNYEKTNISETELNKIDSFIGHLNYSGLIIGNDNYNLLKECITKFKNENNKLHLSPIVNTLRDLDIKPSSVRDYNSKNSILELICSSKDEYIGYVSLISNDFFKNQASAKIKNRLNKNSETRITHKHMGNAPKYYDVILYNVTAIKSIYPIKVDSKTDEKNKKNTNLKKKELLQPSLLQHLYYYELINTISSIITTFVLL